MDLHQFIIIVLFCGGFLTLTAGLQSVCRTLKFPYTVALLLTGFFLQGVLHQLHFEHLPHLPSQFTYFVLLPLLLFESAFHINFHQFQLQFKTITFIATFGLLISIMVIAATLFFALGLSLPIAFLFGALISATDPIAVLSLFKELGAPKRLALVAEGESMFNDATGVIAFRFVSSFAVAGLQLTSSSILESVGEFVYIFIGSLLFGAVLGYLTSLFISRIKNDRVVETTFTIALALLSFVVAEHFFHISGVISTVAAGIMLGNAGRTKISGSVIHFMEELWEYIGFISVSLVFFFAAFNLNIAVFFQDPKALAFSVLATLIGRSVSVYVSFFLTNHLPGFRNEPNVPLSWQHILNWGGLRGVIPLVLVFTLPEDFAYRDLLISFTFVNFVFSLLVNGLTIEKLLRFLKLHIPQKEEAIAAAEESLFALESVKDRLEKLDVQAFDRSVISEVRHDILRQEEEFRKQFLDIATSRELEISLQLQGLTTEREAAKELFFHGHISESVYATFQSEIDMQQDALEYPGLQSGKTVRADGKIDSQTAFQQKVRSLLSLSKNLPIFRFFLLTAQEDVIFERLELLQTRIVASSKAIEHIQRVRTFIDASPASQKAVETILSQHEQLRLKNNFQMQYIAREYPRLYQRFQKKIAVAYAWQSSEPYPILH